MNSSINDVIKAIVFYLSNRIGVDRRWYGIDLYTLKNARIFDITPKL